MALGDLDDGVLALERADDLLRQRAQLAISASRSTSPSAPRSSASRSANRISSASWEVKVLVAATPISIPACV